MTTSMSLRLNLCYAIHINVQDSFVIMLFVCFSICEGCHLTHIWKACTSQYHVTKWRGLGTTTFYWSACTKPGKSAVSSCTKPGKSAVSSCTKPGKSAVSSCTKLGKSAVSSCTKPGKSAVMYLCFRSIEFASFYNFNIYFWNYSDILVFFFFFILFIS